MFGYAFRQRLGGIEERTFFDLGGLRNAGNAEPPVI
jgi:hypothetical protein